MTDCGCEKAKAELEEYLHNEVSEQDREDIAEHLTHCVDCTSEHLVGLMLTAKVRQACAETAPEQLRAEVLLRLRELQSK
jgi:anti-sigma factor (TIGR02949 family)